MPGKCTRGMVLDINLDPILGHEQSKTRPCVVVQNDIGNRFSPVTIVAVITGAENVPKLSPTNVLVPKGEGGLSKDSLVLCNQIRTVDERRFGWTYGQFSPQIMSRIDETLRNSLGL